MALFNEIQSGRFNRALQKLMAIKGGAAVKQLGSEILPVVAMYYGAECRYLESWQRFGGFASQAGFAAQLSFLKFRNPPTSNVIAVVEKICIFNGAGAALAFQLLGPFQTLSQLDFTAIASTRFDARGQQAPACVISQSTSASFNGNVTVSVSVPTNTSYDVLNTDIQEFPVLPNDNFFLNCQTANNPLTVSVWWRERFLEDPERF